MMLRSRSDRPAPVLPPMPAARTASPVQDFSHLAAFADAAGVVSRLSQIAALQGVMLLLLLGAARLTHSAGLDALVGEGAAGLVGAALLISLTGTLACLMLAWGRGRSLRRRSGRLVTRLAGWPQAVLITAGMLAAAFMWHRLPPVALAAAQGMGWSALAGLLLVPAFLLLVGERHVVAMPPDRLAEAARLAALLRVPALTLLVLACLAGAAGFGVLPGLWPQRVLGVLLMAVAGELALRTLGVWFLPPPPPQEARAAIGSVLAALLQPGALNPAELAQRLRTHLGIDITRSWAAGYVRVAAAPVLLGLLLVGWGSTGLSRIGLAERGAYERFGAPVAVLKPGLHLLLPWPFGRVRRLEFGVVHAVSVGVTGAPAADEATADGSPPLSANRLWDQQSGQDIAYMIASRAGDHESFETVSVDVSVLYRIGLDDASARQALYGSQAPEGLVRALSGRLLAHFFADQTLTQVLGARREQVAGLLRASLQSGLDARQSGIEVVAVVVQSLHPPAGAAVAYRGVQAAQINASARRAEERGRAFGTLSVAGRSAHRVQDEAQALAAEVLSAAQAERVQSDADILAYGEGGRAFLLERYFSTLRGSLSHAPLEIVDNRLASPDLPVLDLRAPPPPGEH